MDLQFFKENFDKFLADAKVQVESFQNDVQSVPQFVNETLENVKLQSEDLIGKLQSTSQEVLKGDFLKKDFSTEIQNAVSSAQAVVNNAFDSIKEAIEKAK